MMQFRGRAKTFHLDEIPMHHWTLLATSWQGWLVLDKGPRAIVSMDGYSQNHQNAQSSNTALLSCVVPPPSTMLNADFCTSSFFSRGIQDQSTVCCNLKWLLPDCLVRKTHDRKHTMVHPKGSKIKKLCG